MILNENGEHMVQHHTHYKEIHGYDKIIMMTRSEHSKLHHKLRTEGKCNIQVEELARISCNARGRSPQGKETMEKYQRNHRKERKEYQKEYQKEYRKNNEEKVREKSRRSQEKNNGRYYQENKERLKKASRERYQKRKGKEQSNREGEGKNE